MQNRPAASACADTFYQAIKDVDHGVDHPACLGTRPKHPEHVVIAEGRQARRTRGSGPLGIASVPHLNATSDMLLVDLRGYTHFATPQPLRAPDLQAVEVQIDDR